MVEHFVHTLEQTGVLGGVSLIIFEKFITHGEVVGVTVVHIKARTE